MALTVGELAATITVDDSEAEQGLSGFQNRLRSALSRAVQRARQGGREAGDALGDGLEDGAEQGAEQAGESITSKLKGLALGAVGGALGAALMAGIGQAMEEGQITGRLGAQLGATPAEAQRYGHLAGQLYAAAVTEDFQGAADTISAVMRAGIAPPGATEAQLEAIATKVADLSNTFELDLGQTANAVGQMIKTGLAKDGTEAVDALTAGLQRMGPRADDIADTFNEYSTVFRQMGIDATTATGLLSQGMAAGARDTDVVADALKEFTLITQDGKQAAMDAFKSIGLDGKEMQRAFIEGGPKARTALDQVFDRLRAMKDPTERNAAALALFGTKSEDTQRALLALDPSSATKALGDVAGASGRMGDTLRDNAGTRLEQFKRGMQQNLVDFLGSTVIPRLETLFGFAEDHSGVFKVAAGVVLALGAAFTVASLGVWAMNSAMLANPMFWIIAGVVALIGGAVFLIVTYWDQIKSATETAWKWVVDKVIWAKDFIVNAFMNWTLLGLLISHWSSIKNTAVNWWNNIVEWVKGIPGRLRDAFLNWTLLGLIISHWSAIKRATVTKAMEMVSWVRGLPGRVSSAVGNLGSLLYSKGVAVVQGLWNGIKSRGGWLRSQLIGFAKSMIPGPIADALGIHSPSRVMRDQVGRWIPAGIVAGVEDGAGAVDATMRNLVSVPTAGQATAATVAQHTAAAGAAGGPNSAEVVRIGSDGTAFGDLVIDTLRKAVAAKGGNVQFAITGRA
ncbi:phage tail tape measure protein [Streptomyces griseosporeus]|uniref:phage tail tape measure protein n=1 Tax=Streptomyces griseosporeus TaxID=1910 RepID=UPI0036FB6031